MSYRCTPTCVLQTRSDHMVEPIELQQRQDKAASTVTLGPYHDMKHVYTLTNSTMSDYTEATGSTRYDHEDTSDDNTCTLVNSDLDDDRELIDNPVEDSTGTESDSYFISEETASEYFAKRAHWSDGRHVSDAHIHNTFDTISDCLLYTSPSPRDS